MVLMSLNEAERGNPSLDRISKDEAYLDNCIDYGHVAHPTDDAEEVRNIYAEPLVFPKRM